MTAYPKYLAFCALMALNTAAFAQTISACVNSLMTLQGQTLFVRPSLAIRTAGDAKREWSRLGVTGMCQTIGVSEVLMKLQDNQINGFHLILAPGVEKLLPTLEAPIQSAIIAQLTRNSDSAAMHPVSFFKGDGSGFNYAVTFKKNVFSETLSWGTSTWGAEDER
jgi:hypothetical protein